MKLTGDYKLKLTVNERKHMLSFLTGSIPLTLDMVGKAYCAMDDIERNTFLADLKEKISDYEYQETVKYLTLYRYYHDIDYHVKIRDYMMTEFAPALYKKLRGEQ